MEKTKGLGISNWKEKSPDFNEIKWAKSIKTLGVEFGWHKLWWNLEIKSDKLKKNRSVEKEGP